MQGFGAPLGRAGGARGLGLALTVVGANSSAAHAAGPHNCPATRPQAAPVCSAEGLLEAINPPRVGDVFGNLKPGSLRRRCQCRLAAGPGKPDALRGGLGRRRGLCPAPVRAPHRRNAGRARTGSRHGRVPERDDRRRLGHSDRRGRNPARCVRGFQPDRRRPSERQAPRPTQPTSWRGERLAAQRRSPSRHRLNRRWTGRTEGRTHLSGPGGPSGWRGRVPLMHPTGHPKKDQFITLDQYQLLLETMGQRAPFRDDLCRFGRRLAEFRRSCAPVAEPSATMNAATAYSGPS